MSQILLVTIYATLTVLATGLGAVPFFFFERISKRWLGIGTAIAAGCMVGASVILLLGGAEHNPTNLLLGAIVGVLFIYGTHLVLDRFPYLTPDELQSTAGRKKLLIVAVMTVHSLAEGIGIGVSFGNGNNFGVLVAIALAIHNIPEGLAVSLVLVPRGTSAWKAVWWSIFSSLPQLLAIPAFYFVEHFRGLEPAGLGFAAGAMVWMAGKELVPDAVKGAGIRLSILVGLASMLGIILLERLV